MMAGAGKPRRLVEAGLLAGAAQVVAGVAMYVAGVYFAPWSMVVSVAVVLLFIVLGVCWYRDTCLDGQITYVQALSAGIFISVSTGVVYALYNVVSISFFYPHFLDDMVRARIAQDVVHNRIPESFASLRAQISVSGIAIPNLIRLSVIGSILSLVSSWLLRTRQ